MFVFQREITLEFRSHFIVRIAQLEIFYFVSNGTVKSFERGHAFDIMNRTQISGR